MIDSILEKALRFRQDFGYLRDCEALRVFYGPGECDHPELKHIAIDRFQNHFWITAWKTISKPSLDTIIEALKRAIPEMESAVFMDRSQVASESDSVLVFGKAPVGKFTVKEFGVAYQVQMEGTKHPGLFLDHVDLRKWLVGASTGKTVMNLFSYTGSLSVAAGVGGAKRVLTVDLSKATIDWAKDNWSAANLPIDRGDFIYGDVFEWLPKFRKRSDQYEIILCDPPSFSRSKNGTFSTNKDSARLHEAIFPLLKSGGVLVTSINSENYSERNFLKDLEQAADLTQTRFRILKRIDLPETFPTGGELQERYLKGFYLLKM